MSKTETCIRESCERTASARGLCFRHYNQCSASVSRKVTTWDELVELGLCLPRVNGRKRSGEFSKLLSAARACREEST